MGRKRFGVVATLLLAIAGTMPAAEASPPPAYASIFAATPMAFRFSYSCVPAFACFSGHPPLPESLPADGDPSCTTSIVTDPMFGSCFVVVVASYAGFAPTLRPAVTTFSLISSDGAPWDDPIRKSLRAQAAVSKPLAPGAPAICDAAPSANPTVTCARKPVRTYTATKTFRYGGFFFTDVFLAFPSAGLEATCEKLRVKATVRSGRLKATHDLGTVTLCP